jgi:hypothetical protein
MNFIAHSISLFVNIVNAIVSSVNILLENTYFIIVFLILICYYLQNRFAFGILFA